MIFSKSKKRILGEKKELTASTFFIALFVACSLFLPYIIAGHGYFIFYGDFNVQQITFYKMCHAAIRGGNISWSFTTDLGANFIGSYSFYLLGSPFFWVTIPFPNSFVPYLMGPLLILKFSLAALCAYLYIRRFTRRAESARLGALLYAFSGFSVYNIFFNHFHEAIIVFPLLLLGMEYLITENRRGVFAFTVFLAAVTNYFFFFGMTVFCIIYYIVRLLSGDIKFRFSRFLWLAFEAVLGVLMAAALLLPAVLAILGNSRLSNILLGWSGIMYGKEQIYLNIIECFFFPPDLPARPVFFPGAEVKWSSLGGWLPLFGMTGVISWFYARKKTWIKRLIIICIFMALVPILNSAFYAFNSSYYARWFYMPILIMCLATARVCEEDTDLSFGIKWNAAITMGLALVIGLFPRRNDEGDILLGLFTESESPTYQFRFWITVLIAVLAVFALLGIYAAFKKNRKRFISVATALVCVFAAIYGNFFIALGRTHSYTIDTGMIDSLIEGKLELEGERDTYRIDTYNCIDNTAMFLGYSSINAFHSIVPPSVMEFYEYVGIKRDVGSRPDTDYPALRPLLSVKYLLDRTDDEDYFVDKYGNSQMAGYGFVKEEDGFAVYENENYIGYGYSTDYYMTEDFLQGYSGQQKTRMMLKAVLLDEKTAAKYADILDNIVEVREKRAEQIFNEQMSEYLSESGEEQETALPGEPAEDNGNDLTLNLTDVEMANDAARLRETSAESFKTDKNGFTATVSRENKSLVIFSIPYDSGWSATVNGKAADIEKVNVGFMAVCVEAGESEIRFDYVTPGLNTGLMITALSFALFILYYIISFAVIKRRGENEIYPEGERLLREWKNAEAGIGEQAAPPDEKDDTTSETEMKRTKNTLEGIDTLGGISYKPRGSIPGGFKVDKDIFDDE